MRTVIGRTVLELAEGDIAEQDTDAVVTAAHWDLAGAREPTAPSTSRRGRACWRSAALSGAAPSAGRSSPAGTG